MSSTSAFWRAGLIDFRIAGFALTFAAPAAVLGGFSAHLLPAYWLLVIVGVGLMLFAFLLIRETGGTRRSQKAGDGGREPEEHRDRLGRPYRYHRQND